MLTRSYIYSLTNDDAKLVIKSKWTGNCEELQRDIDSFIGWSVRNGLDINLSKFNIITSVITEIHIIISILLASRL